MASGEKHQTCMARLEEAIRNNPGLPQYKWCERAGLDVSYWGHHNDECDALLTKILRERFKGLRDKAISVMLESLNSDNERIKQDSAKYILDHSNVIDPVQLDLTGPTFTINVKSPETA